MTITCSCPSAPDCTNPAVYNLSLRCCGGGSDNYCWEHLGPCLTGRITAWQSGVPPCPICGASRSHLEDVILLTSIGPGLTMDEAWGRFTKEQANDQGN